MGVDARRSSACDVDVPTMPLFEPSHDERARAACNAAESAGLLWDGESAFSWVANESFWANLMSQALLSPEAREQPFFKVSASHDGTVHLLNQSWLKTFVGGWAKSHPHVVTVETPGGKKDFYASQEFWTRAAKVKSEAGGGVKFSSNQAPGLVIETTQDQWRTLVDTWEKDNNCTPEQRQAVLEEREREAEAYLSSPPSQHHNPTPEGSVLNKPPMMLTAACHKCDELSLRVKSLEEILSAVGSPVGSPEPLPFYGSVKRLRNVIKVRRVKAIRDIKVPGVGVAVELGCYGVVGEEDESGYVVRWDRRRDGKTSRVQVKREWVETVNLGKFAEPLGGLKELFDRHSVEGAMTVKHLSSLTIPTGLLSPHEASHVFTQTSGSEKPPFSSVISYPAFLYRTLPLIATITERPRLLANLLGLPSFSSSFHASQNAVADERLQEFSEYQAWLNQGIPGINAAS